MSTTNQPSKVRGHMEKAQGSVKESIGSVIGNHKMQAGGAAKKLEGQAEIDAARAHGQVQGTKNNVTGTVKETTGNVVGNPQLQAEGRADRLAGGTQL
ncbi:hypothetical protein G9A89_018147 [Geosiphon pyriformis]|nr:hypothetical protein G9A89_018147 [Geosiphon pyriformis]